MSAAREEEGGRLAAELRLRSAQVMRLAEELGELNQRYRDVR